MMVRRLVVLIMLCSCSSPSPGAVDPGPRPSDPCPGEATRVRETCGCNPVEIRMAAQIASLDPTLSQTLRNCIRGSGMISKVGSAELNACVERDAQRTVDGKTRDKINEIASGAEKVSDVEVK